MLKYDFKERLRSLIVALYEVNHKRYNPYLFADKITDYLEHNKIIAFDQPKDSKYVNHAIDRIDKEECGSESECIWSYGYTGSKQFCPDAYEEEKVKILKKLLDDLTQDWKEV